MYAAKQRGGGSVEIYGEGLGARLARRRSIEFDLPDAVRDDALRLVYQPVLTLTPTGAPRVVGVEALLRWTHPRLGDITPIELIPLADATGHIVELGGWVLQESCRQLARWRDAGELPDGFRMFVNLSPRQLLHARLPEQVAATLAGLGLRGDQLVLEVTETAAMDDTGMALRTLEALRVQGIAIALDDFGTGYSSLTHLKRLPLDLIKIDATFVQDLCGSGDDRAIVTAIVSIARQLGAQVVGEGVESRDQEATLRRLGCDLVQGFHVGRPAPAAQLDLRGVGAPSSFV
jgi:EAL domain-containing protein (putative c-di-GMP-specific phosphodiesterase class I)